MSKPWSPLKTHPGAKADDYNWEDGPISFMLILGIQGVARIHYIAGPQNRKPLENLVYGTRLPWFTVGEAEN